MLCGSAQRAYGHGIPRWTDLRPAAEQPVDGARAEGLGHERDGDRPEGSRVERERELRVEPLLLREALSHGGVDQILGSEAGQSP